MDQIELQKNIALFYSKLSPELQQKFSSMEWMKIIEELSERYKLTDPQKQTVGTETTLVLLGIINLEEYRTTLKKDLEFSENLFQEFFKEIKTSIIAPIRPKLEDAYKKNISAETPAPAPRPELSAHEAEAQHIETREEILKRLEQPEIEAPATESVHPIVAEKLTTPTKSTPANTNHELSNVNSSPNPISYPGGADPYRMPPEA